MLARFLQASKTKVHDLTLDTRFTITLKSMRAFKPPYFARLFKFLSRELVLPIGTLYVFVESFTPNAMRFLLFILVKKACCLLLSDAE